MCTQNALGMSKSGKPIHSVCTLSQSSTRECTEMSWQILFPALAQCLYHCSGDNRQQLNTILHFFYPDMSTYPPGWDAHLPTSAFRADVTAGFLLLWCDALEPAFLLIPAVELAPILYFCLSKD